MKHHYQTTLLFLLLTTAALAQTFKPTSHWRAGSSGQDGIWDIAIDTAGNQYICGYFTGTVDVDPGPGVHNLTMPSNYIQQDGFLLKLNSSGNFEWAVQFGGTTDTRQYARNIAIDKNTGDVYVIGFYRGNIQFTTNGPIWDALSTSTQNPFLVKISSNGVPQWGYGWVSPSGGLALDVEVDNASNVYIGGYFSGTFDFNPYPGTNNVNAFTSAGSLDMFLMKLNNSGVILNVLVGGGTGDDVISTLAITSNSNIYATGSFTGNVDLNLGAGTNILSSSGALDVFIMKLGNSLNHKWVKSFGGVGNEYSRDFVAEDSTIYHVGVFYNSIDLDPNPSLTYSLSSNGSKDIFFQKLDTAAEFISGNSIGGIGAEEVYSLSIVGNSSILICGDFESSIDFNPAPTVDFILSSIGGRDSYAALYDSGFTFISASAYGSSSAVGDLESLRGTSASSWSNMNIGGSFFNTIDINPSTLVTQNVTSAGQDDMLYMKLDACLNPIIQYWVNVCGNQFVLPSGGVVTQSGYYLDVVLSSQGCDSTNGITVNLYPLPNTSVTQTGATLTAQPGLSYQWLNCQTNQPIAGETNQTFTATANGQYAVIVSNGNCTDTSACYTVNNIGLHEAHLPAVSMYPNPTSGMLNISSPQPWQKAEVTDLLGRTVLTQPEPKEALDLGKLPTGIYLVKVFFTEGVVVQRVVKR